MTEAGSFRDLSGKGRGEPLADPKAGDGAQLVLFLLLLLLHPETPPFLASGTRTSRWTRGWSSR